MSGVQRLKNAISNRFKGKPVNAFEAAARARKAKRRQSILDRPSKITHKPARLK